MYTHIYVCMYISLSLSIYIYIYIHTYIYVLCLSPGSAGILAFLLSVRGDFGRAHAEWRAAG